MIEQVDAVQWSILSNLRVYVSHPVIKKGKVKRHKHDMTRHQYYMFLLMAREPEEATANGHPCIQ